MADLTPTDIRDSADASPKLAPVMKATRATAVTSEVPRRSPRAKPDDVTSPVAAQPERSLRPANVEIYQGGTDRVDGENVTITQGGASIVNAGSVQIRQGGIANAHADDISVSMGGIALARAERVSVEMGGMGLAFAREAHLTQGAVRSVIAQDVHVDQSLVGTALAGRITFERPSAIFLLVAGKVDGSVQALLDWRGAIAFGAVFGLVVGLLRRR